MFYEVYEYKKLDELGKQMADQYRQKLQSNPEIHICKIGDKSIDMRSIATYLAMPNIKTKFGNGMVKYLTADSVQSYVSIEADKYEKQGDFVSKPKDKGETVALSMLNGWSIANSMEYAAFYAKQSKSFYYDVMKIASLKATALANSNMRGTLNPFAVVSLLMYHWMAQNGILTSKVIPVMINLKTLDRTISISGFKEKTFEELVDEIYPKKVDRDMVYKIIYNVNDKNLLEVLDADMVLKIVARTLKDVKENPALEKFKDNTICERLNGYDVHGMREFCGKQRKNYYEVVNLALQCCGTSVNSWADTTLPIAYELLWLSQHKSKRNEEKSKAILSYLDSVNTIGLMNAKKEIQNALIKYNSVIARDMIATKKSLEDAKNETNKQKDKTEKFRQKVQQLKKENKELERAANEAIKKANSVTATAEACIDPKDYSRVVEENAKLQKNIADSQDRLNQQDRLLNRKNKEIDELQGKLADSMRDTREANERYEHEHALASELAVHRAFNAVPIECFVNAIKNYKIVLVGGNMMFEKLNNYGLTNIDYNECGCRDLELRDFIGADLVVIATAYIDHSSVEHVLRSTRTHKIDLMQFNNKNADMLVYEIFEHMYTAK